MGSSLGKGPIKLPDERGIPLSNDWLLWMSLSGLFPTLFEGYGGEFLSQVGKEGTAQSKLHVPDIPEIVGMKVHNAFVTLKATAPSGIEVISNSEVFTLQAK